MKINNLLTLLIFSALTMLSCHSTKKAIKTEKNTSIEPTINQEIIKKNRSNIIYQNQILNSNIKTLICHKKGEELSLPIFNLNSENKILISFDDLDGDIKDYYYTIIHCNADWQASDLIQNEYIQGFIDKSITL